MSTIREIANGETYGSIRGKLNDAFDSLDKKIEKGKTDSIIEVMITNDNVTTNKIADSAVTVDKVDFIIDEDTMVSNLDTKTPTQQSVKAYSDNSVASATSTVYEPFTATLIPGTGTLTIIPSFGNLISITPTGNITIAFGTFLSGGVNRTNLEIWNPGRYTITFDSATITSLYTPTISSTVWNSFFFRKCPSEKWTWRK